MRKKQKINIDFVSNNICPKLIALEACHRLALSEGLKENSKRKIKTGEKKMRKHVIAWLLLATLFALTMPVTVRAVQHDIDGRALSYDECSYIYPYYPWYCECNHAVWEGDPSDTMAGLGLDARYVGSWDIRFNWAHWDYTKEWGNNMASFNGLGVDACVNGNDHHYYTDYSSPVWGHPNAFANFDCWYVRFHAGQQYFGPVNSVEGRTTAGFYDPNDPNWPWNGHYWWMEAYTQNPSYYPNGGGWSFLTAWN